VGAIEVWEGIQMDLGYMLRRAASEYSDHPAIGDGTTTLTFRAVSDRATRLINALYSLGVRPGDRVAVLLRNRVEYAEVDVALARGGLTRVALNVRLGVEDFSYCFQDAAIRALVTDDAFDATADELVARHDVVWVRIGGNPPTAKAHDYESLLADARSAVSDPPGDAGLAAWFSYTSGTTGRPKGVVLSHRALCHVVVNLALEFHPMSDRGSFLFPQPLSHGSGYFMLACLATGTASYVMDKFDPQEAVDLGARHRINTLKLVPTMLSAIVELDQDVPFQTIIYGASPINPHQLEQALDRVGPILMQTYGQSEAPCAITVLRKHDHEGDGPGRFSVGRPWRTIETAIVDEDGTPVADGERGELIINAPHRMDGYHNLPEETAEVLRDGWIRTKDIARVDEQGFVYLLGRADQMINSGGFNVAPAEIEAVIGQHPSVRAVVAFGVPDERWGEAVAIAVAESDARPVNSEELIDFCREPLGFRRPRHVFVVDSIPHSAYGKVDRSALKAMIAAQGHGDVLDGSPSA
jgi:fatty-acyl-CoA synthase